MKPYDLALVGQCYGLCLRKEILLEKETDVPVGAHFAVDVLNSTITV